MYTVNGNVLLILFFSHGVVVMPIVLISFAAVFITILNECFY